MRLKPGISLHYAEDALRNAVTVWGNARGAQDYFRAFTDAVEKTSPMLECAFATPDLAAGLRSPAYWHLLQLGSPTTVLAASGFPLPSAPGHVQAEYAARNKALSAEIERQQQLMQHAWTELAALKELAQRPGLPVVYDTNMLNHWAQPGDLRWREILKSEGVETKLVRLIIPLKVIDELDRQKYGDGALAKKAATAIRYLERTLGDTAPGTPVDLRPGEATLEVWNDSDHRDADPDLAILRCATDIAALHPDAQVRVLTDDTGMRLRAHHLGLTPLRLPADQRKKGTAMDVPAEQP
ncbi:PIN domain-containing protein [Kitasatospora griseola]|uniref:PIN domain-containing protein n=1 Tax=Kitasatospora griseola TaxID=2064 RepID=UPI00382850C8